MYVSEYLSYLIGPYLNSPNLSIWSTQRTFKGLLKWRSVEMKVIINSKFPSVKFKIVPNRIEPYSEIFHSLLMHFASIRLNHLTAWPSGIMRYRRTQHNFSQKLFMHACLLVPSILQYNLYSVTTAYTFNRKRHRWMHAFNKYFNCSLLNVCQITRSFNLVVFWWDQEENHRKLKKKLHGANLKKNSRWIFLSFSMSEF